jgi:hypothetical protein
MSAEHEEHIHLLTCIDRLNSAWVTLKTIKEQAGNPLIGPAFRYAIVEYSTSFNNSEGLIKKKRKLNEDCVPQEYLQLHKRILASRDQIHAHADINVLESKLLVNEINGKPQIGRIQNYIHGLEELTNILQIIQLIEGTLENLYSKRDTAELNLKQD